MNNIKNNELPELYSKYLVLKMKKIINVDWLIMLLQEFIKEKESSKATWQDISRILLGAEIKRPK